MQSHSIRNTEIQGSRANDIKQSATWEANQAFSSFSFISVALHKFVYFRDGNFLDDYNLCVLFCSWAPRSKRRQRGSSGNLLRGWTRIGTSKRGVLLNLEMFLSKKKKN